MEKSVEIQKSMYKFGPTQQKLLILLVGGITLGLETSSLRYYRKLGILIREWKKVDQRSIKRSVQRLCNERLVREIVQPDGSFQLVLTEEGKRQARIQSLFGNSIRFKNKRQWDGKWRIVMFDIPEKNREFRTILREHLWERKFYRIQQSVSVSPHPCEKQLAELVALYDAESFVRIMTVDWIDNEQVLKKHFFSPKKSITAKKTPKNKL